MPISSLANLLLAAGLPKISPSILPSLDFTFRPSVLAGAGSAFEAAGAGVVFEPLAAGGLEEAGGGASVFLLDAQPRRNTKHAAETGSLLGICQLLCNSSSVVVILVTVFVMMVLVLAAGLQQLHGREHAAFRWRHSAGDAGLHQPCLFERGVFAQQQAVRHHLLERSEEHTSELQSLTNLVCRLLLEKKKNK